MTRRKFLQRGLVLGGALAASASAAMCPRAQAGSGQSPNTTMEGAVVGPPQSAGAYTGRYVTITLCDMTVYVRSLVLSENDFAVTIRFRNAPYSIPWRRITSIEVVS